MNTGSFVIARIGSRRVALPAAGVSELINSSSVQSFPQTTPLIVGVVVRRGRILPVIDMGLAINGEASPSTRFFLVVERQIGGWRDRCAIPVQGECELVSGSFSTTGQDEGCVIGSLEVNGEKVNVLELESALAYRARAGELQVAEASS